LKFRFLASLILLCAACTPSSHPSAPAPARTFSSKPSWPERAVVAAPAAGRLVVTNNLDDSISFFDVSKIGQASFPELSRVPVGINPIEIEAPHHAAASPTGEFFYVALSNYAPGVASGPHGVHGTGDVNGAVVKIRASDNRTVGSARVDRNPGDLTLSADGKLLAVSHFDLLRITEASRGEATDPDARIVFIVRLDVADFPVTRVKVASNAGDAFRPIYQPYALAESPLTGDVFISCLASSEVRVLKADTLTIDDTRTRLLSGTPFLSAFSADGKTLWVPRQGDDRISDLDPATGVQRRQLTPPKSSCTNLHSVLPTPDGKFLIAVCEGFHVLPGTLVVLDTDTGATVSVTEVGIYPDYVGFLRTP
jgi:hypothetical protein